jgi:hypothetical protein
MIIEFCGFPGAGKSTLVDEIENRIAAKDRKELLKLDHKLKYFWRVIRFSKKDWLLNRDEKFLYRFSVRYPDCDLLFVYRLLKLYRSMQMHKQEEIYLLDEGPIQYLTSIAYESEFEDTASLKQAANMMLRSEKIVFFCECPLDIVVERIRQRDRKNDRYNIADESRLRELLAVKISNIRFLLKYYEGPVYYLDMEAPLSVNVEKVMQVLKEEKIIAWS